MNSYLPVITSSQLAIPYTSGLALVATVVGAPAWSTSWLVLNQASSNSTISNTLQSLKGFLEDIVEILCVRRIVFKWAEGVNSRGE